jgi:hypothetical protein
VPKKQGQGLRIVQDFRLLNQHSHIDKYSMKEIRECIGDIGRANSSIFTTLDLTSGFWQMKLDPESQPLTAFYHPEPRTISLDHLTHGPARLPSELPEVNGTSSTRIEPHTHIHR